MNKGYIIFFGEKPYYIVDHLWPELYAQTGVAGTIIANHPDATMISKTIRDMDATGTRAVIILTDNVEYYWAIFKTHFTPITAGGGVVYNDSGKILFIFRRQKWDLPKGKHDEGETIEECSLREVKEETGLTEVHLQNCLGNTYHVYREKGKTILKTTVWFSMRSPGNQPLIPQTEEDIEDIKWLGENEWSEVLNQTYPSIKLLLEHLRGV